MNYNKKTIMDVDVAGKKVLLRCDFNVPQDKVTGAITSDARLVGALPTINYLLEKGAAVIACSHLGKPKGEWKDSLTLQPVAVRLGELLGKNVIFAKDIVGEDAKAKAAALKGGEIMLLENLRFDPREEKNDPAFAKELADMAELYVSDAFGTVHRAHASTAGVAAFLPAVSGLLVAKELSMLGGALDNPKRPLVAILGGAKVSSKIGVINNLLEKADTVIIGGGMSYTFSAAQGGKVGNSLLEADWEDYANDMVKKAAAKGVKFLLPVDTVVGDKFDAQANSKVVKAGEIEMLLYNISLQTIGDRFHFIGNISNATNRARWDDPDLQAKFDKGLAESDDAARKEIYKEIQNYIHDAYVYVPLYYEVAAIGWHEGVTGIVWTPDTKADFSHIMWEE